MKELLRQLIGVIFMFPFVLLVYLFSVFTGRNKAIKIFGPIFTSVAGFIVQLVIPKIESELEFDSFIIKFRNRFWIWKVAFDAHLDYQDNDMIRVHVPSCPFCAFLKRTNLPELQPYVCQGDWEVSIRNSDKWIFERTHQIGTGDNFCNHTYKRK